MAISVTKPGGSVTGDWEQYLPGMSQNEARSFIQNSPYKTETPPTWDRPNYSGPRSAYPWTRGMDPGMTNAEAIAAIPEGGYTPGGPAGGKPSGMTINDIYARMRAANQSKLDAGSGPMYSDQQMGIGLAPGADDWRYNNDIAQQMFQQKQQQNRRDQWNAGSPSMQANSGYSPQLMQKFMGLPQLPPQAQAPNQTQAPGNPFAQPGLQAPPPQMPVAQPGLQAPPGSDKYLPMPPQPLPQMPPVQQQPGVGGLDMQRQSTLANALRNTTAGG